MVNSFHDPADGEVLAFEEQIGSHGGLGGAQSRAFLLSPVVLSAPVDEGAEIVGAEQVHRVLRRWLRESNGPQVPVDDSRPNVADSAPFPRHGVIGWGWAPGHGLPPPRYSKRI
ncbi:hypothetical protein SVIOM342S_08980 [Streptomyces violaceorubidus]